MRKVGKRDDSWIEAVKGEDGGWWNQVEMIEGFVVSQEWETREARRVP
jgi:hypothetical protein